MPTLTLVLLYLEKNSTPVPLVWAGRNLLHRVTAWSLRLGNLISMRSRYRAPAVERFLDLERPLSPNVPEWNFI